jgi:hypothetical protein
MPKPGAINANSRIRIKTSSAACVVLNSGLSTASHGSSTTSAQPTISIWLNARNFANIERRLHGGDGQAMQQFMSDSPWSGQAVFG